MSAPIYHITTRDQWLAALERAEYRASSLDDEGFIHCSLKRQVLPVANFLYRGQTDLVLLKIDPDRVSSEIRHEGESDLFPHIYGPLDAAAVTNVIDFPCRPDGLFAFPDHFA